MDTGLQNLQPSTNIPSPQTLEKIRIKRSTGLIKIFTIISILILLFSTVVLAYQNYMNSQIITKNGLQDYFGENRNSVTLPKTIQTQTPISFTIFDRVTAERDLQKIKDEAIRTARGNDLSNTTNEASIEATPSFEIVNTHELDNYISFQIPSGWSNIYTIDETKKPLISIYSRDFKAGLGVSFTSGIYIAITKQSVDASYTINNEDNETNKKYLKDFKITTIGGKPAAYGYLDFETYSDRYFVLNNLDKWTIFIGYGGKSSQEALSTKARNKAEIDQFLNSISFK